MYLMRPRVSDFCYPEAMIVRKRTTTNKTSSQNNADILIWSAGWLLHFFQEKKEGEIVPFQKFIGMGSFLSCPFPSVSFFLFTTFTLLLFLVCMSQFMLVGNNKYPQGSFANLPNSFILTGGTCLIFENTTHTYL